jgi:hypothetical protein
MDLYEVGSNLRQLWDSHPGAIVLLSLGFVVFVFLVVDARRHKRRHRRRRH